MKRIPLSILALALGLFVGCSGDKPAEKATPANTGTATNTKPDDEEAAPHGGTLFATKDHSVHLEVVTKDDPVYLYVYDGKVKNLVPTAGKSFEMTIKGEKPTKIEFKPARQEKDPEGQASRFSAAKKDFPEKIDYNKVEISGEVNGKPYHFVLD